MEPIKIVAINTQGFFEKEINRFISNHRNKPDILICTEHKQRDLYAIEDCIDGYKLVAGFPAYTGQRGSAIFIKRDLPFRSRRDLEGFSREDTFEACSVEIPGFNVVVTGLYRSSRSKLTEFNGILDKFLKEIKNARTKRYVIGGDFNIDLPYTQSTADVLKENDFRYHIRSATHDMGGCLDNFITSSTSECSGRVLTSKFSDHRPIQLTVPPAKQDADNFI